MKDYCGSGSTLVCPTGIFVPKKQVNKLLNNTTKMAKTAICSSYEGETTGQHSVTAHSHDKSCSIGNKSLQII